MAISLSAEYESILSMQIAAVVLAMMQIAQLGKSELQVVREVTTLAASAHPIWLNKSIEIQAILPDGSHALLNCSEEICQDVQSLPPEKLPPREQTCVNGAYGQDGNTETCTFENVGIFRFTRKGDSIIIFHRSGKTKFIVVSSW